MATNVPSLSAEEAPKLKPYMALAVKLGSLVGQLTTGSIPRISIHTDGAARGNPGPAGAGAILRDADGAVSRHEHTFFAAPDPIRPEIAITRPEAGYAAVEASDFSFSFRAFDNVKVERLEVATAYGGCRRRT